jgi:hypothetical protein
LRERGEGGGVERGDGTGEFGVVLGAAREKERVHAVEVGEERGGGASVVGRGEGFAVGVRVVPGTAEIGIGVEDGAQIFGFGVRRDEGSLRQRWKRDSSSLRSSE